ncbi:MAG: hypothetical protein U0Q22_07940 [Acidimicrobiales bacterium]
MQSPPEAGWWMASDGEWYPPEEHPTHRLHPSLPAETPSGFKRAQVVHPIHQRPGAGDFTVKAAPTGSETLRKLAPALGVLLIVVALGLGLWMFTQRSEPSDSLRRLSATECASEKTDLATAMLRYKAKYLTDPPTEASLVPEFLAAPIDGWDLVAGGGSVTLTPTGDCR